MIKIKGLENVSFDFKSAVCLGNFDGLHLGHRQIISILKDEANKLDLKTVVFTLDPHPFKFFGKEILLLSTPRKREELFEGVGADYLVTAEFDTNLGSLSPEVFFEKIIVKKLNASMIVVGEDFRFGAGKSGDKVMMQSLCHQFGIKCVFVEKVKDKHGLIISSSLIRQLLKEGESASAARFLDRPYSLEGMVIHGDGRGKLFGFPTANLDVYNELIPACGVYAGKTFVKGRLYDSMIYVGYRPTLTKIRELRVESNIFDFDEDIYGEFAEVLFFDFIRNDRKFCNELELKIAIKDDMQAVKTVLAKLR